MCRRDMAWNAEAGMYELMSFLSYILSSYFYVVRSQRKSYIFLVSEKKTVLYPGSNCSGTTTSIISVLYD
jgi:hypothetical protein